MQDERRALFICKGHNHVAGAQRYLSHLSALFMEKGYEVHFAFHQRDGLRVFEEIARMGKISLWEYDWRHLPRPESFIRGIEVIRKVRPRVIVFNSNEDRILPSLWGSALCRVRRRLLIVHWSQAPGSLPWLVKKAGVPIPIPSRYSLSKRLLGALSYRQLTGIIFVNHATRKAYLEDYYLSPRRCTTIHNGTAGTGTPLSPQRRDAVRASLDVSAQEHMLLGAGNLTPVKGFSDLIESAGALVRKGFPLKAFIAGEGELEDALERQIAGLRLTGRVRLLGYRGDLGDLTAAADVFCMPSLNEGSPYSLLEAMSYGTPVIASSVGGIPEIVADRVNGLLVPPRDPDRLARALEVLLRDPELRSRLGENARETVAARFSLGEMLSRTRHFLATEVRI
ncbi:MAG: glycosyltransferase family 4 protein [bacterium]